MRTTVLRVGAVLGFVAVGLGLATATATAETTDDRAPADSIIPDIHVIHIDQVNVASPLLGPGGAIV
ncbi:hypothetical protein [Actinokineospora diospyrosa]|uniref:Uncharacterized protein n=1 Tax=Actinokineospora diospyrosa TaxID=103728 RepID=A0ABT1IB37_9PSEU|nr:hypothetical protein [Actinokineospora diospyrosa]MCP2269837.1 hypothetical protein [Actinokineospora diospyrosa]